MVRMTGLEPATPCSQSKRPTNWATSVYNGDSDGNRTHDLQRDRLAFYTTELRSHILVGRAGLEPAVSIKSRIYSPVRYQLRSTYPYGDGGEGRTLVTRLKVSCLYRLTTPPYYGNCYNYTINIYSN